MLDAGDSKEKQYRVKMKSVLYSHTQRVSDEILLSKRK